MKTKTRRPKRLPFHWTKEVQLEVHVRIQAKYLFFSFVTLMMSLLGIFMFSVTLYTSGKMFWGFWIIIMGIEFYYNTHQTIKWHSRARRFKVVFGVDPPNNPENMDWKFKKAIQPIVDECLKLGASTLHYAINHENKMLEKVPENLQQAVQRANDIESFSVAVKFEKKIFWSRRNLAWEWGFGVYSDYKSYITQNSHYDEKIKKQF